MYASQFSLNKIQQLTANEGWASFRHIHNLSIYVKIKQCNNKLMANLTINVPLCVYIESTSF